MKTRIELFTEGNVEFPYHGVTEEFILSAVERAGALMGPGKVSVTVIITDNAAIQTINRDFRKKDAPTDVISFAYRENPFPAVEMKYEELGDLYLSIEQARRQAKEYGVTLEDEVKRLLVHGLLHLVGYDHEVSEEEERRMRAKEEEILGKI